MALLFYSRYKITDLSGHRQFLIDAKLSVCFNDPSPCVIQGTLLSNYLVTKPACAWYTGFLKSGQGILKEKCKINEKSLVIAKGL